MARPRWPPARCEAAYPRPYPPRSTSTACSWRRTIVRRRNRGGTTAVCIPVPDAARARDAAPKPETKRREAWLRIEGDGGDEPGEQRGPRDDGVHLDVFERAVVEAADGAEAVQRGDAAG